MANALSGIGWIGLFIYALFLGSLGVLLFQYHRYRDVEHWPSVPVLRIENGSGGGGSFFTTRDGRTTRSPDISWVEFDYEVGGHKYHQEAKSWGSCSAQYRPTPEDIFRDGVLYTQTAARDRASRFRAYYCPDHPEIAVLHPRPYEPEFLLFAVLISALLSALHLFFTFKPEW